MNGTRYLLLHQTLITAIYDDYEDLRETLRSIIVVNRAKVNPLKGYDVYELEESVFDSGVYINPKKLDPLEIIKVARYGKET